ncbi:hypothetical protein [Escherichia coli]|uniref:hypothetical protein n=1 Tax=Escherichia coli TaxID=562 RepID=UPI00190A180C|nr:hypothetical protein [Escherichia coli]MDF7600360.1 hypothetical protein [Escherichia coli]MDF7604809.1 hypothetical protein [Escherichia coli]MDF7620038.1 hypothetical protein [Escherichia coli]
MSRAPHFYRPPSAKRAGNGKPLAPCRNGKRRAFTLARPLRMQGFASPPSSPGRSDFMDAPLSSRRFPAQVSRENRPERVGFFCAAACGVAPAFSAFRRAVVSARRMPAL